jgi:hypothetical protein
MAVMSSGDAAVSSGAPCAAGSSGAGSSTSGSAPSGRDGSVVVVSVGEALVAAGPAMSSPPVHAASNNAATTALDVLGIDMETTLGGGSIRTPAVKLPTGRHPGLPVGNLVS